MNYVRQLAKDSIRFALGSIYKENSVYLVPFGPWRGMKLRYFSSLQYHMILGLYDTHITTKLAKVLRATGRTLGQTVYCDLGANVGMYSLWFSRLNPDGKVFAFEPVPETLERLKDHVHLNEIKNIEVIPKACSSEIGTTSFFVGNGAHEVSSLNSEWAGNGAGGAKEIKVQTTTLDSFFTSDHHETPDFIKMDIEGGGIYALKGCKKMMESKKPIWMIESHNPAEDRAVSDLITQYGYSAYRVNNSSWVKNPSFTHPDPDGVWGTVILVPGDEKPLIEKVLG